jgi:cytochrome c oxidase subunit IV
MSANTATNAGANTAAHDADHAAGHVASKGLYVKIFLALMGLTMLTVAVTYVDLGWMNLTVALAIAVTKAILVILFFMHMRWSPKLIKVTFGAGFFFFLIMIVITMSDYLSRGQMGLPAYPASGIAAPQQ